MMSPNDRLYVEQKLTNFVAQQNGMRGTVVAFLPPLLQQEVPDGLLAPALVRLVIDLCIRDAWTNAPPTLVALVGGLIGTDARIAAILATASAPPPVTQVGGPTAQDAFDAVILTNRLPFLGRSALRAHARVLASPERARPLIVVTGGDKSGKSFSGDYLEHICVQKSLRCSRSEVKPMQGKDIGPGELARDLMTDVDGDPDSLPPRSLNSDSDATNLERWTLELAKAIIAKANESHSVWWFIFDGFNKDELRDDTKRLIINFALLLQNDDASQHRLILIDFDRSQLTINPGLVAPDVTESIPHSRVRGFMQYVAGLHATPLNADKLSSAVLRELPDPVVDLTKLGDRLGSLVLSLEALP